MALELAKHYKAQNIDVTGKSLFGPMACVYGAHSVVVPKSSTKLPNLMDRTSWRKVVAQDAQDAQDGVAGVAGPSSKPMPAAVSRKGKEKAVELEPPSDGKCQ